MTKPDPTQKQELERKIRKKEYLIHRFDPQIYPIKIHIAFGLDIEAIKSMFDIYHRDTDWQVCVEKNEVDDYLDMTGDLAMVVTAINKIHKDIGLLIVFKNKNCKPSTFAHEASHATREILKRVGISCEIHEPYEYLLSWIMDKIYEAKNYKHSNNEKTNNNASKN